MAQARCLVMTMKTRSLQQQNDVTDAFLLNIVLTPLLCFPQANGLHESSYTPG
jgi:hypothetical protein